MTPCPALAPEFHPWVGRVALRLVTALAPQTLYFFGSSARRAPELGGDLDFLAILPVLPKRAYQMEIEVRAVGGLAIKLDVLYRTSDQVRAERNRPGSFLHSVWPECHEIYTFNRLNRIGKNGRLKL